MQLHLLKNLILLLLAVSILFSALLLNHVHVKSNTSVINIPEQLRRVASKTQQYSHKGKDARQNALELDNPENDAPKKGLKKLWSNYSNWSTRLAMYRATHNITGFPFNTSDPPQRKRFSDSLPVKHIAVLIQMGNFSLWEDMLMCGANVATAAAILTNTAPSSIKDSTTSSNRIYQGSRILVDFFISVKKPDGPQDQLMQSAIIELQSLQNVGKVYMKEDENKGADILPFLKQLHFISEQRRSQHQLPTYEIILKQHSKSDPTWRQRHLESLCGTPEQVISILKAFHERKSTDMIVPQGTAFQRNTPSNLIFPHIVKKYKDSSPSFPYEAFDPFTVRHLQKLYRKLFPKQTALSLEEISIVAGSAYWFRYTDTIETFVRSFRYNEQDFTVGYVENLGIEHVIERLRLIPTAVQRSGGGIEQIPPAPRVVALYFPQFHSVPENDKFWGKGFTEWTILRPSTIQGIRKPLPVELGGLGYYNLLQKHVRKRQADLARMAGLSGFVYYHYWFSGTHAPKNHLVMDKIHEALLHDGEPNMPFMLSWANEPWSKRWTGLSEEDEELVLKKGQGKEKLPKKSTDNDGEEILLSQDYGDEKEWEEHFRYLVRFFQHPNYIRIEDKPVFIIYRLGHIPADVLGLMLNLWNRMAMEEFGLPGLHIVHTVGNFYQFDKKTRAQEDKTNGAFHFWPQLLGSGFNENHHKSSTHNLDLNVPIEYWGAYTGFDRRVRDPTADTFPVTLKEFSDSLQVSFEAMATINRNIGLNLYFVTAWNEWNEQAVLEPDDQYSFGYLDTLQKCLQGVPVKTAIY